MQPPSSKELNQLITLTSPPECSETSSETSTGVPYLILHKVRGTAAFDIAEQIQIGDEMGWIIPTSGHRAYPAWSIPLHEVVFGLDAIEASYDGHEWKDITDIPPLPKDWPDHYQVTSAPKSNFNIMKVISPMMTKIKRRL
jgi:hypothetical protein